MSLTVIVKLNPVSWVVAEQTWTLEPTPVQGSTWFCVTQHDSYNNMTKYNDVTQQHIAVQCCYHWAMVLLQYNDVTKVQWRCYCRMMLPQLDDVITVQWCYYGTMMLPLHSGVTTARWCDGMQTTTKLGQPQSSHESIHKCSSILNTDILYKAKKRFWDAAPWYDLRVLHTS